MTYTKSTQKSDENTNESAGDLRQETEAVQYAILTILAKGNAFKYIIPSFPVFNADIIQVKLQWEENVRMVAASSMFLMGLPQIL